MRKIRSQFDQLDANGDGTLSFTEVQGLLKRLNPAFSQNQLQRLFCEMDSNQNGKIEIREFMDFIFEGKKSEPDIPRQAPKAAPAPSLVREEWKAATILAHNERRKLHDASPLEWSDECYEEAKKQADACQAKGSLFHGFCSGRSGRHGQNGYWSSMPGTSADAAVGSWYDEMDDPGYNFDTGGYQPGTGHFTQVVWKGSTHVGMAVSQDGCFIFANYWPAGNNLSSFGANIARKSGGMPGARPSSSAVSPSRLAPPSGSSGQRQTPSASPRRESARDVAKAPPRDADPKPSRGPGPSSSPVSSSVTATSMTPELEALFDGCPFEEIKSQATEGLAKGATVTVDLEERGREKTIVVSVKLG